MSVPTVEERLNAIEKELAQIKQQLTTEKTNPSAHPWDQVFGIFADDPLFEEAVRLGREWRDAQNALTDEEADVSA